MIALPIVVRELRVAARRDGTYWTRLSVAFVSMLIGGYALAIAQSRFGQAPGAILFSIFSWMGLFYCVSIGLRNSADCMSEEKREGTLGLLFLTDLKGYDIVLGKLVSTGTHSFYSFLAAVPVFSIALMLGGVTGTQFWRASLALLNIFLFAHAAGLLASTFSLQARKAYVAALVLALLFFIGPPTLEGVLDYYNIPRMAWLELLNPGTPFVLAQIPRGNIANTYWVSLLITHGISWCFLGLASWRAPFSWQDRSTAQRLRWRERVNNWSCGNSESRRQFRHELTQINPFFWLVSRNRLAPFTVWIGLVLGFFLWVWFWYKYWRPLGGQWQIPVFITTIAIVHTLFKFFIASEASRHFEEQRRDGSLEFLLSCTPLKVPEIIKGHCLALRRHFLWPTITILLLDSLMLIGVQHSGGPTDSKTTSVMIIIAAMILLMVDAIAIGWVGMWLGLSVKKPRRASGKTIFRILFVPWILFFLLAMVTKGFGGGDFGSGLVVWFLIGLLNSIVFAALAKTNLEEKFRELAVPQHNESHGAFEQLGQALGAVTGKMIKN